MLEWYGATLPSRMPCMRIGHVATCQPRLTCIESPGSVWLFRRFELWWAILVVVFFFRVVGM